MPGNGESGPGGGGVKIPQPSACAAFEIGLAGLDLLSRLHIREGMDLCVSSIEWRWGNDYQKRLEYLKRYGGRAKEVLPELRKKRPAEYADGAKNIDKAIADIEASTDSPTVVSLKDFIAHAAAGGDTSKNTGKPQLSK